MGAVRHISKNFSSYENACNCNECSQASADIELVDLLEWFRAKIQLMPGQAGMASERRVFVNSWYRCRAHNNRPSTEKNSYGIYGAGSNDNSWHLIGAAADVRPENVSVIDAYRLLCKGFPSKYGFGYYGSEAGNFIHIDVRPDKARWTG